MFSIALSSYNTLKRFTNYLAANNRTICISMRLLNKSKKFNPNYSIPYPPKDPPADYNPSCVEHDAFEAPEMLPAAVFRKFQGRNEVIGPNANKKSTYKNPEYYCYHRFSFAMLQKAALDIREGKIQNSRKSEEASDKECKDENGSKGSKEK